MVSSCCVKSTCVIKTDEKHRKKVKFILVTNGGKHNSFCLCFVLMAGRTWWVERSMAGTKGVALVSWRGQEKGFYFINQALVFISRLGKFRFWTQTWKQHFHFNLKKLPKFHISSFEIKKLNTKPFTTNP